MIVIGIDCATDPGKVGMACADLDDRGLALRSVQLGARSPSIPEVVSGWLEGESDGLIAIDAPLGWPADLGSGLSNHVAGQAIATDGNQLFRRATDRFIKKQIGKQPLDVGADRIARTALAALGYLEGVRQLSGRSIPMAWTSQTEEVAVIEVYPAATLRVAGLPDGGYKGSSEADRSVRRQMIQGLSAVMDLGGFSELLSTNADLLDAAVCCLAAADFLAGNVHQPTDWDLVRKESWIWVRR